MPVKTPEETLSQSRKLWKRKTIRIRELQRVNTLHPPPLRWPSSSLLLLYIAKDTPHLSFSSIAASFHTSMTNQGHIPPSPFCPSSSPASLLPSRRSQWRLPQRYILLTSFLASPHCFILDARTRCCLFPIVFSPRFLAFVRWSCRQFLHCCVLGKTHSLLTPCLLACLSASLPSCLAASLSASFRQIES